MSNFEESVNRVLEHEGGLVDNPLDKGGITNHGISLRFLSGIPFKRMVKYFKIYDKKDLTHLITNMSIETAKNIYKGEFWENKLFEQIEKQIVCNYYFDMSINHGESQSTKIVQRSLWAANEKFEIVKDDGIFGFETLKHINRQPAYSLLSCMMSERSGFYRLLVEKDPSQKEFLNGWLKRCYK